MSTSRQVAWATGLAAATLAGLGAGYALDARMGLIVVAGIAAAAAVLATRLLVPAPPQSPARPHGREEDQNASFPAYRRVSNAVGVAEFSRRHYDAATRPLLHRLLLSTLAERRGAGTDAAARAWLGEELWPYVDVAAPRSRNSDDAGVPGRVIARIVERMEAL